MDAVESKIAFSNYIKSLLSEPVFENEIASIIDKFTFSCIKKNAFFVREGEICTHFCFVESGILQHSIIVSGEEKTSYLALKKFCYFLFE